MKPQTHTIGGHRAFPASASVQKCPVRFEMFLFYRSGAGRYWCLCFYVFPFFLSVSLYLFNRSISLALPLLFISTSFSAGRVSFLGVTMATMGSPHPFQSPHRFRTTSAWSKTSSSQVKRALHSEWKHIPNISSMKLKNQNFNSLGHTPQDVDLEWQEDSFTDF